MSKACRGQVRFRLFFERILLTQMKPLSHLRGFMTFRKRRLAQKPFWRGSLFRHPTQVYSMQGAPVAESCLQEPATGAL